MSNQISEWTEITHPFHPLCGKQFEIINRKKIRNVETFFLKGTDRGTFAIPQEWTDKAKPSIHNILSSNPTILDYECLVELADVVERLMYSLEAGELTELSSDIDI